ncbi:Hypothetical predicted protein [Mytilus galloprovincialis]|uniref:Uncharacterized protein n=1 Tax=Mytilus galloprovincialis TaxID=29158 RepID=A0A8B6C0F2_MYTGA|nr:Hypothetical predicted protein [Mytilus galloprovincialis]
MPFFQTELKFLGKLVSVDGVSVNPENIQPVSSWPIPKNKKEVESFIGFANYQKRPHKTICRDCSSFTHAYWIESRISLEFRTTDSI